MEKHLIEFKDSLHAVIPEFKDFQPSQSGSWEPIYDKLNEAYQELLCQKNNDRAFVKKMLPILAEGHLLIGGTHKTRLTYSPAHYAMGIMAIEDNKYLKATKHFETAIRISKYRPQERNVHLYGIHALAQALMPIKEATTASILYTTLFANLEKNERPFWEPKIRAEITKILAQRDQIALPWRIIPAMFLSLNKKERGHSLEELSLLFSRMNPEVMNQNQEDIASTMKLIRTLADKNLSPEAQAIMAYMHLHQRDKQFSFFDLQLINTLVELEKALKYARSAYPVALANGKADARNKEPRCEIAKPIHGEVAYRLGRYLEKKKLDESTPIQIKEIYRTRTKELYKESALCEFDAGVGRHTENCLEDTSIQLPESTAKEYINILRRISTNGSMAFQDMLAKIFFLGYTFGCGYTINPNIIEAYEHAKNSPSSIEMLLIRGVIESTGIEKSRKKSGKVAWEVKPNETNAKKSIDTALEVDEELSYVRLYELYQSDQATAGMKEFIFNFIQSKCALKKPSKFAVRQLGVMHLSHGNPKKGVTLLEILAPVYQTPYGHFELSSAYLIGIGVAQDIQKATDHCIKGFLFYDTATIKLAAATPARQCIHTLLMHLNSDKLKENEMAQKCLQEFTTQLELIGITWRNEDAKELTNAEEAK